MQAGSRWQRDMPHILQMLPADALDFVDWTFRILPVRKDDLVWLAFETEEDMDEMCAALWRLKRPFVRLGFLREPLLI